MITKITVKQRSDCTTFQWSCLTFWIKNEFLIIAYQALWHQCPLHPHHHSQWISFTFLFVFLTLQNNWRCFHQRHLASAAFPFWCVFSCFLYPLLKLSVCSYHILKVPFLETYSSYGFKAHYASSIKCIPGPFYSIWCPPCFMIAYEMSPTV